MRSVVVFAYTSVYPTLTCIGIFFSCEMLSLYFNLTSVTDINDFSASLNIAVIDLFYCRSYGKLGSGDLQVSSHKWWEMQFSCLIFSILDSELRVLSLNPG